jgi:glycosyltransferase involved in cell wall biosynthesis
VFYKWFEKQKYNNREIIMSQKTIVYANTIDWDFKGLTQRPHHVLKLLSERGYKVYWIDSTQRTDKVRTRISDNLEIYHNWNVFRKRIPNCSIYFSSWANRYVDLNEINAEMVVYDSLDAFPEHEHNELSMINLSSIVLAASQPLYDLRSTQHSNVHLCKNACFAEHGDRNYAIPNDLLRFKQLGKPLILFSGALSSNWCNLDLVEKIAEQYALVVVGRGWNLTSAPKNVHYLGTKTHEELQAYYRHCDVNILPFVRGQIADFSSPIKNFEAMIHGTPTVASDIPEVKAYPNVILSSKNDMEFMSNIKKAIKLKNEPDYKKMAIETGRNNTWNHRVDVIDSAIQQFYNSNSNQKVGSIV